MTEVVQEQEKSLSEVSADLVRDAFKKEAMSFIEKVRGLSEDAAQKAESVLLAVKDEFTPEVAIEVKELISKGDETSLEKALGKVRELRAVLA